MPKIEANTDISFLVDNIPHQRGGFDFPSLKGSDADPTIELTYLGEKRTLKSAPLSEWTNDVGGSISWKLT